METGLQFLMQKIKTKISEASIYQFLPGAEPIFEAANTILQDKIIYASAFPFRPLEDIKRFLEYKFNENVVDKLVYKNAARLLKIDENQ